MNNTDNTMNEQIWTTPNQRKLIALVPQLVKALKDAESALFYAKTEGEFDTQYTKLQVEKAWEEARKVLEQTK